MKYLLFYLIFISIVSAAAAISDKRRAVLGRQRWPERTLITLSALGGSAAMFITMKLIRHKTQKPKFMVGIPVIIILQTALAVLMHFYGIFARLGM
jgi:uncharacterized membrane protein YsdA (DUF1294 family)